MANEKSYLLAASIHSCIGDDISGSIAALRTQPSNALTIERRLRHGIESMPYKLLSGIPLEGLNTRLYRVLRGVVAKVLADSNLTLVQRRRMSLFVGSSSFDVSISEAEYQNDLSAGVKPLPLRLYSFGNLAAFVCDEFGIRGEDFSFSTACTASANALLTASEMIEAGVIDHALVLGVELYNDTTALGFLGLGLLSDTPMKPFDEARNGLVLGEGCGAVVLGRETPAEAKYYIAGGASMCDTYNVSSSNPDGSTVAAVIHKAIVNSGFSADQIAAIKTHGTASLVNDEAEAAGLLKVFKSGNMPPLCAIKPFIGHTLGACGLLELVLFCNALDNGFLIANTGISVNGRGLGVVLNQSHKLPEGNTFLLNYFGFGGNNCALVLAREAV